MAAEKRTRNMKKIVIFEENDYMRAFLKNFICSVNYVKRGGYVIEAEPEPWNAKDQIDESVVLAMLGHSLSPEWNTLAYLRDAPEGLVSIVGSPSMSNEERMDFIRAGALFTYDRPFSAKGLDAIVCTALKIGSFLVQENIRGNKRITIHLRNDLIDDLNSCLVVESYRV